MTEVIKGKALRQDLALYDGITPTRQRKSSSGGYVQGLAIGDEVDVLMVHGQGLNRTQTTIQNCVNSLGSLNRSIKFSPGTWTIESNTTIPANLTAIIPAGCVFSISSGVTLTFSGPVKTDSDNFKTGSGTLTYKDDRMLQSVAGTNTVTASTLSTLTVLKDGQDFLIIPAVTNTGAVTINVNSTGAVNTRKNQSGGVVALVANDFIANNLYRITYVAAGPYYIVTNVSSYAQGADIASATTINLDTATGDYVHVTGTTTITGVTLKQGQERTIVFDDALTFTNGASLLLPGAANITTAAGDTAVLRGEASSVVRCISYTPKAISVAELTLLNGLTELPNASSGSYTATATGLTTSPTITVNYRKIGPVVILETKSTLTGTSNATTFTVTGAPASIRPVSSSGLTLVQATNNGTTESAFVYMDTSGVLQVGRVNGSAWTGSGTKALAAFVATYIADV